MSVEPFKYLLQPVALERDGDGRIVREMPGDVISVFSAEQAQLAITEFERIIAEGVTVNGDGPEG